MAHRAVDLEDRIAMAHFMGWTLRDIGALTLEEWQACVRYLNEYAARQNSDREIRFNPDPRAHIEYPLPD